MIPSADVDPLPVTSPIGLPARPDQLGEDLFTWMLIVGLVAVLLALVFGVAGYLSAMWL